MILLGSLMLVGNAAAKEQKIGFMDLQSVASQMKQMTTIQANIQAEFKDQIDEFDKLQKDLTYNNEKLQRDHETMNVAQVDELRKAVIAQQEQLEVKRRSLVQAMKYRSQEERNKVLVLINQAVKEVAEKGGYDLIIKSDDPSKGGDVFYNANKETSDISAKVLEQIQNNAKISN